MAKISLNPQQKKASETLSGPVLILAGAGAGKTMTLTARIIKLILSGVLPQNILAITFTNKAAGEMKERISKAIEQNEKINFPTLDYGFTPFVSTFHALGVYIIRENCKKIGVSKYFSIYDRSDMKRAIKEALKVLDLDPQEWGVKNIISFISKNKGNCVSNTKFAETASGSFYTETMGKIWTEYEKVKRTDKALDFDDLLLESALLLERDLEVREHYLRKWSHIHIDEYQDTNKVQYKIADFLTNPETQNIFVVGDDDQSVYGWRGSDIKNILDFEKKFDSVTKIFMEQNYRSTKNIIEASNHVIEKNETRYPKKLFTESQDGDKILVYNSFSEKEEARFVAQKIKERLDSGVSENDIAVLYRSNFQSRVLEEAILQENISYQVLGTKFFDRAEVKDIISYIRAAKNPDSLVDIKRVINSPKRGIGKTSVVKIFAADKGEGVALPPKIAKAYADFKNLLQQIANKIDGNCSTDSMSERPWTKMSEVVNFVIEVTGYQKALTEKKTDEDMERLSNIYELANFAQKYDVFEIPEAIERFLEDVALMSDSDTNSTEKNKKKPAVKLMTIHASKGLEFDTIFLTGAEDHFFLPAPEMDHKKQEEKREEERRLFYVAMTRSKEKLFISWSSMRTVYGKTETNLVCDFVLDIPPEYIEEDSTFVVQGSDDEDVVYLEW